MKRIATIGIVASIGLVFVAPAGADPGKGHGPQRGSAVHERSVHADARQRGHCPPGLAKKSPACVPPGQARHHGLRPGDVLREGNYRIIRDPGRHDLPVGPGWDYYRDDGAIYRVDRGTRQVLAVLELIDAFAR